MGPTWGPLGAARTQVDPMLATRTLLSGPSWALVWNKVHLSKFVVQKSRAIASDFCGIQTHSGELHSDSISSAMFFFSCDNFTKTLEITLNSSEITVRGQKSLLSVEEPTVCQKPLGQPLLIQKLSPWQPFTSVLRVAAVFTYWQTSHAGSLQKTTCHWELIQTVKGFIRWTSDIFVL